MLWWKELNWDSGALGFQSPGPSAGHSLSSALGPSAIKQRVDPESPLGVAGIPCALKRIMPAADWSLLNLQ